MNSSMGGRLAELARAAGLWAESHRLMAAILGLLLFVVAVWSVQLSTKEKSVVQKPFVTGSVTSRDGTKIGYRQYGQGPGLVLLHGGMMAAQDFSDLASLLSDQFTVYVPDRRSRGLSGPYGTDYSIQKEVDDLRALLDATGSHNVFALSVGAIIALQSANQLPEIRKLAVYEPPFPLSGHVSTWRWVTRYDTEIARGDFGAALITVAEGTGDSSFLTKLPRLITVPFMNFAIKAQAKDVKPGEVPLQVLIPTMHNDAQIVADMEGRIGSLGDVDCAVLLLGGSKSPDNLRAPLAVLNSVIPHATSYQFKGANHLAATNGERPRMVAEELQSYFSGQAPRPE